LTRPSSLGRAAAEPAVHAQQPFSDQYRGARPTRATSRLLMPEAQPTCACTLDEQLTPMGRAVVNPTQGDEVVRIIFTALRTSHQIVNIDEPRVMAARHRAAAVIAMDHTAPQGSDRFRQAIRDRKMKPVIGSTPKRPRKLRRIAPCTGSATWSRSSSTTSRFSRHRHTVRDNCTELPRSHTTCLCVALARRN
jgi:hypothetical protein